MLIRGPILNPQLDGSVEFIADAALADDGAGRISFTGDWNQIRSEQAEQSQGIICPAFLDNHIHIPQHPIRGKFMADVPPNPQGGRLIAALNRNVFPAERLCADPQYTRQVVHAFLKDTLAHGVIGGAAYMTVHPSAARIALEMLPATWSVGPVLMDQNCPQYLRTDAATWEGEYEAIARDFGRRVIITDRFAVAVSAELRRAAVRLARRLDLRMQTHLNEQISEKQLVERTLYPEADSYTAVYARDGLLDCKPILAHCVRMRPEEFELIRSRGASIAHCPTSNTLLGSGIMPLDLVHDHGIDYAICTDVGASPTTSMLCEMAQFLTVHAGRSRHATPEQALCRSTLAPARMLGLEIGSFDVGKPMTFIEIECRYDHLAQKTASELIRDRLLEMPAADSDRQAALDKLSSAGLDQGDELALLETDFQRTVSRLDGKVLRVVIDGQTRWRRNA